MRSLALAFLVLAVPLPALAHEHDDEDPGDAPAVLDRGDVVERLARIDDLIADAIGRARGRQDAQKLLRRARQQLENVRDQVSGAPNPREWRRSQREPSRWFEGPPSEAVRPAPPPPAFVQAPVYPPAPHGPPPAPPPPALEPMSDASLAQLLSSMDQQASSGARLRVLQQAAPSSWFLARQVQVLLGRLWYQPDQVQAARLLQPRLVDRENEWQLASWLQPQPPGPSAGLVERASFEARSSVRLQPGLYRGTFTVAGSSLTVEGAGRDQTVVDGNLVVNGAFDTVRNLTVLGKVVILGSQNQLRDVDYRAGIEDKGLLNKY